MARISYPELSAVLELVELRLQIEGLLQVLQELALECYDLVDISEKSVYLGIREECLAFHGLQIVFQQIVQMLQDDTEWIIVISQNTRSLWLDSGNTFSRKSTGHGQQQKCIN